MPLPRLPNHKLEVVEDVAPPQSDRGFLFIRKMKLAATFESGEKLGPFPYDTVGRTRLDAVVVVPHYRDEGGEHRVFLRSALRPPVAFRPPEAWPFQEKETLGAVWEVPAGLVEEDERSPEGVRACAARELYEEAGFSLPASAIRELGPPMYPAPGMIGERHFFFQAEVDPAARVTPPEDGSALEKHAVIAHVSLREALEACRSGEIEDSKTELALRRLAERVFERSEHRS